MKNTILSQRSILIAIFTFLAFNAFSATSTGNEAWRILERAQMAFERGESGEALLYCEEAREVHTSGINAYIEILKKSLAPAEVRKAGDDIRDVYAVLEKRNDSPALAVFDAVQLNHPANFFGKSVTAMLVWLEKRLVYPEADLLVGKIYEGEGENKLALSFYEKAWKNRDMLDIAEEQYTLIYRMADLSANMQKVGAQEAYLLIILTEDPIFGKPGEESPTLRAMLRTLESEPTTDKFFSLYRHSNFTAYKAYLDLSHFYYYDSRKRLDRALPVAALSATIAVTRLTGALVRTGFEYVYSGLPDLFNRIGKNGELAAWARDNRYWDSFLVLASVLYDHGERIQALYLWNLVADNCPDRVASRRASVLAQRYETY